MTVSTETNRVVFAGDGTDNSPYAISFPLRATGSVEMFYITDSTGAKTSKVITTDYTIAIATDFQTATLSIVGVDAAARDAAAPATGVTMVIRRNEPATRLSDYSNFDGQPAGTVNADYDKLAMLAQTLQEQLDRVVVVSKGHPNASLPLTPLILKGAAGKTIVVKSDESDFELLLDSIADGTIVPAKLLDGTVDNQLIQYDSGAAEWKYEINITVPGTLAVTGAVTLAGTLTVNSNANGTTILGRTKITSGAGDEAVFAHFDRTTNAALTVAATGNVILDCDNAVAVTIKAGGTTVIQCVSTPFTTLTGGVTITGNLAVNGGNITSTSDAISFGNENLSTTGTLASGALTITGASALNGAVTGVTTLATSGLATLNSVLVTNDLTVNNDIILGATATNTMFIATLQPATADLNSTNPAVLGTHQPGPNGDTGVRSLSLQYATAVDQFATWFLVLPQDYDGRAIVVRLYWATTASSGDVKWEVFMRTYGDGDTMNENLAVSQSITVTADTVEDVNIDVLTFTPSQSTRGQLHQFKVKRDGSDAADTHGGTAHLIAVEIAYT